LGEQRLFKIFLFIIKHDSICGKRIIDFLLKMASFDKALIATHIIYRQIPPYDALEGPYSSVCRALESILKDVETCQIPLNDFNGAVIYGHWRKTRQLKIPSFLGQLVPLKYLVDLVISAFFALKFSLANHDKKKLAVGIDPLSCLPLAFLKKIFNYRLVFYSVDFNKNRFKNRVLQWAYEKADELSTRFGDQTWVVCQSLKDYKKKHYHTDSIYIPNSPIFNGSLYQKGKKLKAGNKMAWTGSFLTERQYEIFFGLLKEIQDKYRPDMEFYFAPMQNHDRFRNFGKKYGLKKFQVLELHSRLEWQEFAAKCDVGIAIYDPQFGSTKFIEPLKIWDFMMVGMPFIISCEPSISTPIKKSGVAYFLAPNNKIPKDNSLKEFLKKENIIKLQERCIELAKEFDIQKQIKKTLKNLST